MFKFERIYLTFLFLLSACKLPASGSLRGIGEGGGVVDQTESPSPAGAVAKLPPAINTDTYVDQDSDLPHLPYDKLGWTVYPDYDVTIYMDSKTGNDGNWVDGAPPSKGNTKATSIASFTKLTKILADNFNKAGGVYTGKSVKVVIKRGSSYYSNQAFEIFRGGTADHPFLLTGSEWYDSQDDLRPHLHDGIRIKYNDTIISHVAIQGLEINPNLDSDALTIASDPYSVTSSSRGISITQDGGTDYLIEDCAISHWFSNVMAGGTNPLPLDNLRIRRSQLSYATGHIGEAAVGLGNLDGGLQRVLVEDSVFDMNGVPTVLPKHAPNQPNDKTIYYSGYTFVNGNVFHSQESISNKQILSDYENPVFVAKLGPLVNAKPGIVNYDNAQAHDVYFAIHHDVNGVEDVHARDIRFRGNIFTRTVQSQKGLMSGVMDDNMFYAFRSFGYIGPHGSDFSNNIVMNGNSGVEINLDNGWSPNHEVSAVEHIFGNLFTRSKQNTNASNGFSLTIDPVGVNLDFHDNVLDDAANGIVKASLGGTICYGISIHNNVIYANDGDMIKLRNPDDCPLTIKNNDYFTDRNPLTSTIAESDINYTQNRSLNFTQMQSFFSTSGDSIKQGRPVFSAPQKDLPDYLAKEFPQLEIGQQSLIGYLKLRRNQTQFNWHQNLQINRVNAYIRGGHDMTYMKN